MEEEVGEEEGVMEEGAAEEGAIIKRPTTLPTRQTTTLLNWEA